MNCPFPGVDPYLERHWPDVHSGLIAEARRSLNRSLPVGLVARAEERLAVEEDGDRLHHIGPDVRVFTPWRGANEPTPGAVLIDAPYRLEIGLDPVIERFIRIINEDGEVLTVLEFISPANKRYPGLEEFRRKREELLRAGVHCVEIDLVRAGDWRALMRPEICPSDAASTYRVTIRTSLSKPAAYLFPIQLADPLPDIPIPLRPDDPKVTLPLGQLWGTVYQDGRYGETLNYTRPLEPPLSSAEAAWAAQVTASL